MGNSYDNPVLSTMEQKINTMLGNSGFAPDWIMLDREIRAKVSELKGFILAEWNRCGPHPMSHSKTLEWEQNMVLFQQHLEVINKKIRDRNLKGPLVGQKVSLRLDSLVFQVVSGTIPVQSVENESTASERTDTNTRKFNVSTLGLFLVALLMWGLFR